MKPTVFNYQEYERVVEENKKLNAEVADLRIRIADKRDCKSCKHQKADGCSRWDCEYEPRMDDIISRQDAIEAVATVTMSIHLSNVLCDKLLALPSADRPTGEWISEELANMICDEICYYKEVTVDADSLNDLCEGCLIKKKKYGRPTGWIPVSERLPDIGDTFLVTVMVGKEIRTDVADSFGSYIDGFWDTFNDWIEDEECHVIAWMPLPEPYDRSEDER